MTALTVTFGICSFLVNGIFFEEHKGSCSGSIKLTQPMKTVPCVKVIVKTCFAIAATAAVMSFYIQGLRLTFTAGITCLMDRLRSLSCGFTDMIPTYPKDLTNFLLE